MKKFFLQLVIIVALFFSTWFVLNQLDWMTVFEVEKKTDQTEEKLGELFWEMIESTEQVNTDPFIANTIDSIIDKICKENEIDKEYLKVHVLNKDEVNAFAMPNGHLAIYSGLILASENQEELTGVICHEIAHIQLNHIMEKLVREVGIAILISMTTGNNSNTVHEIANLLTSSAFDRSSEKEADIKAVDYLVKANINPEAFANFLYKLSDNEDESMKYLSWISTHPDSKERAKYIIEYSGNSTEDYETIISEKTWNKLKDQLVE